MPVALRIDFSVGTLGSPEPTPVKLVAPLERLSANLRDFGTYMFPPIIKAMEREEREHFALEGAGGGVSGAWAELTPKYAAWKRAHYPGRKIGNLTGKLRAALTSSSGEGDAFGNSGHAHRAYNAQAMTFGTDDMPYASFMQEGTSRMVARPPIDFSNQFTEQRLVDAMQIGLVRAVRAADNEQVLGEVTP